MKPSTFYLAFPICTFFLFTTIRACAQYYENENTLELSAGMKYVKGSFKYTRHFWEDEASGGFALQPTLRADVNVKLFRLLDQDIRIGLTGSTGILQYFSADKFDVVAVEPFTGDTLHYVSKNPTYLPIYLGFYSPGSFSVGFEAFYYKGLGVEDLYGYKFLSFGYSARKFRVGAALEAYDMVRKPRYISSQVFFSFEFLWKFKKNEEY